METATTQEARLFEPYVYNVTKFREMMKDTSSYVVGASVLKAVVTSAFWESTDLTIVFGGDGAEGHSFALWHSFLLEEGYDLCGQCMQMDEDGKVCSPNGAKRNGS